MNRQDLSMLSSDYKLLVTCCQYETDNETIQTGFSSFSDKNYQDFLTLSHQHGIYPLVYRTVRSIDPDSISTNIRTLYKQSNMLIAQSNMLMSAELLQIMQLFNKNSIDAMAFKGPVLGEMAYGSVTLRQYGDLDILIKRDDIKRTLTLLLDRGYIPEIELEENTFETFYNCVNVIGLQRGAVRVEIHWELLSKNYAIDWEEKKLWSESKIIKINHQPVKMLSFENHILYLCAHGSKHLFERLEWICDIDRAIRTQESVNWEHLTQEARAMGIERMLLFGLHLSKQFFDLPLPQDIAEKIEQDQTIVTLTYKVITLHYSEMGSVNKSYSEFGILWSMRERRSDRLRFAYLAMFAPTLVDYQFIKLPKHLTFLYPLIRPYRLITKYFKY